MNLATGISLYLQGTPSRQDYEHETERYIPVPTGNSLNFLHYSSLSSVYPCTYRELSEHHNLQLNLCGISLYLQGTHFSISGKVVSWRYIPVPTGNSYEYTVLVNDKPVYPCTYRELAHGLPIPTLKHGISLYLQGTQREILSETKKVRYIPVPTGNSCISSDLI